MNLDEHSQRVEIVCPTCGSGDFEGDLNQASASFRCRSCGREMTLEQLIEGNSEGISVNQNELAERVIEEAGRVFKEGLKKSLRGKKGITFK